MKRLAELLEDETAGDPCGKRGFWTRKRLRQIAKELAKLDIAVSPNTVRRLLKGLKYGLHANSKSVSVKHKDRNEQFLYIANQKKDFLEEGLPVISVDSKKKEMVGDFENSGRVWSQMAVPVNDHDFRSQAKGMAIPHGIYDLTINSGSVFVGTSHDTPQFAAQNIARWWVHSGRSLYDGADQLLVLADSGGSNGARVRAWKWALQQYVADRFNLAVTVCHYPTGASKWNPIEHRLFSEISKHWAGHPLDSYSTILRLIGETTTETGLWVKSYLITKFYETGQKPSAQQMKQLCLQRHAILPDWNYTIFPRENRN